MVIPPLKVVSRLPGLVAGKQDRRNPRMASVSMVLVRLLVALVEYCTDNC